jgi:hypothetical protein
LPIAGILSFAKIDANERHVRSPEFCAASALQERVQRIDTAQR